MRFGSLSPRRIRRGVALSTALTVVLLLIALNEDQEPAFILAVVAAVSLIGDHVRRAVVLTGVSWGFSAAWIAWNALAPATGT